MPDKFEIFDVHYLLKILREGETYKIKLLGSTQFNANEGRVVQTDLSDVSEWIKDEFGDSSLNHLIQLSENGDSKSWEITGNQQKLICVASRLKDERLIFSVYPESFLKDLSDQEAAKTPDAGKSKDEKNVSLKKKAANHARKQRSAEQELNDFTYSVSHDLRAPLRRLDGFSEALLSGKYTDKLDEKGIHYLKRIRKAAIDMGILIDNLLKLSRISRKETEAEEIDISTMVEEIIKELYDNDEGSKIDFYVEDDIIVEGDRGLVKVMIQNLLENAVKYSSKNKTPKIKVKASQKGDKRVISVQDNGVGFDSRHSNKLFRAFQRLHSDFEFEGHGIGLATVKRIVNLHGGEVWAEGKEGEGATFSFYL